MDDKHKHTDECLSYAATTGLSHCIAECRDSRKPQKEIMGFPVALSKTGAELLTEIFEERDRQDKKWGDQRNLTDLRWLGILAEEMGEAAEAILEDDLEQMRKEVIHACAVTLVWLECIDRNDPIRDRHKNAAALRVIARDIERGSVQPEMATLPRINFLRRLSRHLEEN